MTKAKEITIDITENINTQKILLRLLICMVVLLSGIYFYLIGSITFNIVARRSLENNIANLSSEVSQMDLAYLSKVNQINKEYAISNGFVELKQNLFVSKEIKSVAVR